MTHFLSVAGLLDIYRAIDWCRLYINYFGGDPDRMTLAGQGAGAVAAGLLSLGHGYARTWYRLILQSGSPLSPMTADPQEAATHSYNIAVGVGCANESFRLDDHPEEVETCMKSVDPLVLMEEEAKIRLRPGPYSSFVPTWGSSRFPYNPYCDFLEGNYDIQEILIGTNHFDGAFQIAASDPDRFGSFFENDVAIIDVDEAKSIFRQMFPYVDSSDVDEVFRIYDTSDEFRDTEDTTWIPKLQLARAVTDLSFTCPSQFFAEKATEKGVKVYYYDFKFKPETSPWPQWMRPTHFEEIQYVFGRPYLHPDEYSPGEIELSRSMIEMWTNFTKMLPTWPLYTNARPPLDNCFIQNSKDEAIEPVPRREQCDIFRKYFGRSV
ncbi:Acetylcholinesterase-1 [Araneus ventricosus]|uniref:Acetylcholinesterase-1 n=1 Tax=Araneus ventricosus TaxID=182803 RepID=A0A4Y2NBF3_ARAVE|nr:Acetylcholinesterase-1 [Araneus ventricosus]